MMLKVFPASLGFLMACAMGALPAQADVLLSSASVERVVSMEYEDGSTETEYVPAKAVEPGEELAYVVSFRNDGAEPADSVVMTIPVPKDMIYVEDSVIADNAAVDFSVDGGESFAPRDALTVEDGEQIRKAAADEITHVRWTIARMTPGEEGMLAFHAILN